jgi:hypothetical protein
MSVNLTVEIHGLCALLKASDGGLGIGCLAGHAHTPVLSVPTEHLVISTAGGSAADRIFAVDGAQYAQWDLTGCDYLLGDPASGPATLSDKDEVIFRIQAAYSSNANASPDAWSGPLGKLLTARMKLFGGDVQPVTKTLDALTLMPVQGQPNYSHLVTDFIIFTAPNAPDTIELAKGKLIALRNNPTLFISNFGNAVENTQFAHFDMYHDLLANQQLPVRKVQSAGVNFGFPVECVPPSLFDVI